MDDGDDASWKRPADLMGPCSGGVDLKHASSQVIVKRLLELCNTSGSVTAQSPGGGLIAALSRSTRSYPRALRVFYRHAGATLHAALALQDRLC